MKHLIYKVYKVKYLATYGYVLNPGIKILVLNSWTTITAADTHINFSTVANRYCYH